MTALVAASGLAIGYDGTRALDRVDLVVEPGETLAIIGESGSGKTTFGMAVGRVLAPGAQRLSGTLEVAGIDVFAADAETLRRLRRETLGFVFQNPMSALDPTMRIGRQVERALGRKAPRSELAALLGRARIDDPERVLKAYPHELSGGMAQRVVIAMAIARAPKLLVADEPTASLDASIRERVLDTLEVLRADAGAALIVLTHDLRMAARRADRVAVMHDGKIVEVGASTQVFECPAHPYTAALLASAVGREGPGGTVRPIAGSATGADGVGGPPRQAPQGAADLASGRRPPSRGGHAGGGQAGGRQAGGDGHRGGGGTTPVARLDDVHVVYGGGSFGRAGTHAVRGVSLEVTSGETLGLVGESGSGKTTLGRVCLGLLRPTSGRILFNGKPFGRLRDHSGELSVVLQHPESALNPRLRCGASVAEPLAILGRHHDKDVAVARMFGQVGLDPAFAERFPGELSGGQRQRVAIARALITEPRLIVFDEAVSALDVSVQAHVLNLIRELQAEHGFGALFISHDLAATRYVCHRIAVMRHGAIVEEGPSARFYGTPEHPYTRELMAAV